MKIANLIGLSYEIPDEKIIWLDDNFFWAPINDGVVTEKRSGAKVCSGGIARCRKKLQVLKGTFKFQSRINSLPSIELREDSRRRLIRLHRQWKKEMGSTLRTELNKESIAGNLFVPFVPKMMTSPMKEIAEEIEKIQKIRGSYVKNP